MAKAEIFAGVCGYHTEVLAQGKAGYQVSLEITSECADIQALAGELKEVNAFEEISFRKGLPRTLDLGHQHCAHAACPVPAGIIKAVEVASGLALPTDVEIKLSQE